MPHAITLKVQLELLGDQQLSNDQRLSVVTQNVIWSRSEWYQYTEKIMSSRCLVSPFSKSFVIWKVNDSL